MKFSSFKQLNKFNQESIIPALKQAGLTNESAKIEGCGNCISTIICNTCGTRHFHGFSRCKSKFCATCSRIKSSLWRARLFQFSRDWLSAGKYIVFLNLTIRDRSSLQEGIDTIENAWSYLTSKNTRFRNLFKSHFVGGFKALEVKEGSNSKLWHPHLHLILYKEKPIKDIFFLRNAWATSVASAGGSLDEKNLEILPFSPFYKSRVRNREDYNNALLKSIIETAKYMTKIEWNEIPAEKISELVSTLKNRRQFSTFGVLQNLKDQINKDMEYRSESDIRQFICQACGSTDGEESFVFRSVWEGIPDMLSFKTVLPSELKFKDFAKFLESTLPDDYAIEPVQLEINETFFLSSKDNTDKNE